jgi:hypothetical protein
MCINDNVQGRFANYLGQIDNDIPFNYKLLMH